MTRGTAPGAPVWSKRSKHFHKVLADHRAPKNRERWRRALLFLVHFVEDVHQPLHVGDNRDRGGNLTQIQFHGEGTNLHRVWDSDIVNAVSRDERLWVERIEPLLTTENIQSWSRGTVEDWTNESLQDAKAAYHFPKGSRNPIVSGATLDKEYVESSRARPRSSSSGLAQTGVRPGERAQCHLSLTDRREPRLRPRCDGERDELDHPDAAAAARGLTLRVDPTRTARKRLYLQD